MSAVRSLRGTLGLNLETFHFQTGLELVHRAMGRHEVRSDLMKEVFEKVNLATLQSRGEGKRDLMEGPPQPGLRG